MKTIKLLCVFFLSINTLFSEVIDSVKSNDYFYHKITLSTSSCKYKEFLGDKSYDLLLKNNKFESTNNSVGFCGIGYGFSFPFFSDEYMMSIILRYDYSSDIEPRNLSNEIDLYEYLDIVSIDNLLYWKWGESFFFEYGLGFSYVITHSLIYNYSSIDFDTITSDDLFNNLISSIEFGNTNLTVHYTFGMGFNFSFSKYQLPFKSITIGLKIIKDYCIWSSPLELPITNVEITDINFKLNELDFFQLFFEIYY